MYARVSRYEVPVERLDEDIRGLGETERKVADVPGFRGIYYLVDRMSGHTMSITLWDDQQAMDESESFSDDLRRQTSTAVGARVVSVERYEVASQPSMAASAY